jgi:DNA polymerase-1
VLGIYAEQRNEFCQKLLEKRKLEKLRSTYLENYAEIRKTSTDGRVRSDYFFGTKGGRLSSSKPNMQNLPKDMRRCFRSRYRDGLIIDADFKQAELRVFEIYSKDETLIKMLNEGEDLHRIMVARAMSRSLGRKVGPEEVTDEQRQRGKGINFGLIYGRGPVSIAKEFKLAEVEAETFHQEFFTLFKRAKRFHDSCIAELKETGFISSLLGRKRYLANLEDHAAIRRALNFPIQSLASDVCLWTLCRIGEKIRNEGLSACIIGTVHDSIVIDSDIDCAERVVELVEEASHEIPELFEGISKLPVGFEVEINVGYRWGEYE